MVSSTSATVDSRDVPGSHVVVRLPKKHEVPQETLLDAATLAHLALRR